MTVEAYGCARPGRLGGDMEAAIRQVAERQIQAIQII